MTVIATASNPRFQVSRMEVDRDGPTYTVDTLRGLKAEHDADLFFISGADAILEIVQWKQPEELFELAHFIAATRPGYDIAAFDAHPADHGDEHPGARRSPRPTSGRAWPRTADPLPGARRRELLRTEGGAVPVSVRPARPRRAARSARPAPASTLLLAVGAAVVVVVAIVVWRAGDDEPAAIVDPQPDGRAASPAP